MSADAYAYARSLKALLPPSRFWRLGPDSFLSRVFLACGDELVRIAARAQDLLRESDPRQADELLPDFERVLELPSDGTIEERRARVVALFLRRQRFRPIDFQTVLAPFLGLAANQVAVLENSRAFAQLVANDREIYRFYVYRDPALGGTYDLARAQAMLDAMKPSHTLGFVIDTLGNLLSDDPNSLCDQHRLGV